MYVFLDATLMRDTERTREMPAGRPISHPSFKRPPSTRSDQVRDTGPSQCSVFQRRADGLVYASLYCLRNNT